MLFQDIWSSLRARLGNAVKDVPEIKAGDPYVIVEAQALHEAVSYLKSDESLAFDYLRLITGVELPENFASIYHLYSYRHAHSLTIRVLLDKSDPRVRSIFDLHPAANWLERETFDMLGIVYEGHPELRRILLPLDWEGYPLRKDYKQPASYHGISNE